MDLLEERINYFKTKYKNIWYMADGVYSMFGDKAPLKDLERLMYTYPQFRLYIDDAHGMSVYGKNGCGYVLSQIKMHPQMILGTSLNKAFASGGGVMVYPTQEMAHRVRVCGGPMITSGPIQPAMLGAGIASAAIHLSAEITELQNELHDNIRFATLLLQKTNLPVLSDGTSPVFFIGVSLPKIGYKLVQKLIDEGFYVNLGLFPAVPLKNTGIRFTITRLHTFRQIEALINALEHHWHATLLQEGVTMEQVYKSFKMELPIDVALNRQVENVVQQTLQLNIKKYNSIQEIDPQMWNKIFEGKGNYDYNGMLHIEKTIHALKNSIQHTDINYFVVYDSNQNVVLVTFSTCSLQKDDMLAPDDVSQYVEKLRKNNPTYLTSKVLQIGSVYTEGEQLYVDYANKLYQNALILLFEALAQLQDAYNANNIVIRDFIKVDYKIEDFFIKNGFLKVKAPSTHTMDITKWQTIQDFEVKLNATNRYHYKKDKNN